MAKSKHVSDALSRLAEAEERFLAAEFLAPVVQGGVVQVRVAGVICSLHIQARDFTGWGVFRPKSHGEAIFVRQARLAERQRYLELFPVVRLILAGQEHAQWVALPAHQGDTRFQIGGLIPVRLVEEAQLFEVIETRFDGCHFWYAVPDARWDPTTASYLRQELAELRPPDQVQRSGLTAEERAVYALNYRVRYEATEEARRGREEVRLRDALAHAGAELTDFVERPDVYTVTFEVDGQRHVSAVAKQDLTVQVAGICLSGEDEHFDLQSLVGVIREANQDGGFVRVGGENQGMAEEDYWRVHPRR